MTKASPPPLLSLIQHPESVAALLAALRQLKNEIIGQDKRKEDWISWGIIPTLAAVLANHRVTEKQPSVNTPPHLTAENDLCRQAIIIIGSLAKGGSAFLYPIFAGGILPLLFSVLASPGSPQSISIAVLETLNNIADELPLDYMHRWPQGKELSSLLFSPKYIPVLYDITSNKSSSSVSQRLVLLVTNLISKMCTEDYWKTRLVHGGVLDALALRLAGFIVAQGFVLPGAENQHNPGSFGFLPPAVSRIARLASILRAISTIIENSPSRAERFVFSPGIKSVFPTEEIESVDLISGFTESDGRHSWRPSSHAVSNKILSNPIDSLLPAVPATSATDLTFPLAAPKVTDKHVNNIEQKNECAIVSWLFFVARAETDMTRLMAARLLVCLWRLSFVQKSRVSEFGNLLIPLLVNCLDKDYESLEDVRFQDGGSISTTLRVKEEAPLVLASLMRDSPLMQKFAEETELIKPLSFALKESFKPLPDVGAAQWNPEGNSDLYSGQSKPPELTLGPKGLPHLVVHRMRFREGLLRALADLASWVEDYRKAIPYENGAIYYIIESMKPCDFDISEKIIGVECNPSSTLIAACVAMKSLTRSPAVLRTSLADFDITTPLFKLLNYPIADVQIAATALAINLAQDVSPMKMSMVKPEWISTLCQHSHSPNTRLRFESFWVLKHLVYHIPNETRIKIVEQIDPAFLKQIICQDPGLQVAGSDINAPSGINIHVGEQSNASVENLTNSENDVIDRMTDPPILHKMSLDTFISGTSPSFTQEDPSSRQVRQDDSGVLEQALDFIRNLFLPPDASQMINFIYDRVGQAEFFDILEDKLRPRTRATGQSLPVSPMIISSVLYILVHIAAASSQNSQQVVQRPELIKLIIPFFSHPNHRIRCGCVWLVINLLESKDDSCRDRALVLNSMGVTEHLQKLQTDPVTDIRDRIKVALKLMEGLLG